MTKQKKRSMTLYEGLVFFLLSCCLSVYSLVHHAQAEVVWKQSPYLFPLLVSFFLLPLSLSVIKQGLGECGQTKEQFQGRTTLVMICSVALYIVFMGYLGFIVSTSIFIMFTIRYLGEKRWVVSISLALLFPLVLYWLFATLLHVMLP